MKVDSKGRLMPVSGFSRWRPPPVVDVLGPDVTWWKDHTDIVVSSTLRPMKLPGVIHVGPTWMLGVSRRRDGKAIRVPSIEMHRIVTGFGLEQFDEDNHYPGVSRSLFIPVDPAARVACECKIDEDTIEDGDYAWTNPVDAGERDQCRGCEYETMTRALGQRIVPCPIHSDT